MVIQPGSGFRPSASGRRRFSQTFAPRWRAGEGFACVGREECSIFLTNDNQSQPRMWVWIGVGDVRALHEQYLTSGARIRNPPNNFEWALEMQVEDLDGNVLRIGSDREKEKPLVCGGMQRGFAGDTWATNDMSASIE